MVAFKDSLLHCVRQQYLPHVLHVLRRNSVRVRYEADTAAWPPVVAEAFIGSGNKSDGEPACRCFPLAINTRLETTYKPWQENQWQNQRKDHGFPHQSRSIMDLSDDMTTTAICGEQITNCIQTDPDNRAVEAHSRLDRNRKGWRHIVLNFTPSWFSVNMGTGMASILLFNLPYNARWLYWISVVIFCLNVFLFLIFFGISVLRYTLFRGVWSCMIRHPIQSLFLGTFPMALSTIINMVTFVCVPAWGSRFATLAWTLWWIDVVCAVATNFYLPFVIMYKHEVGSNSHLSTTQKKKKKDMMLSPTLEQYHNLSLTVSIFSGQTINNDCSMAAAHCCDHCRGCIWRHRRICLA